MDKADFMAMRAFGEVAKHGSFSRAAAKLGIAPSTLSQMIKTFEARLGIRLLNRTTRRVSVTTEGGKLLSRFAPALEMMDRALDEARDSPHSPRGTVRLHIPRPAYDSLLSDRLGDLHERFPDLTLDLTIGEGLPDIVEAGFDLDVRRSDQSDHRRPGVSLGPALHHMLVASPAYLAAHGTPTDPAQVVNHARIGWRRPGTDHPQPWRFLNGQAWIEVAADGPLIVSHCDAAIGAASAGVGLAFVLEPFARAAIEQDRLVPLLQPFLPPMPGWRLSWQNDIGLSAAVRAVIGFLEAAHPNTAGA